MENILHTYLSNGKRAFFRTIEEVVNKNYFSARAYYKYRLGRSMRQHNKSPLLIYQMGKVGSSTVLKSLRSLELDMPIYHVHYLSKHEIAEREKRYKKYFGTDAAKSVKIPSTWLYEYLRKQLDKGLNGKKWKIVTLVRDPIAKNIASFFQHCNNVEFIASENSYQIESYRYGFKVVVTPEDIDVLTKLYFEEFTDHDFPLKYFDIEFKGVLGVDVFASEFPKSKGYKIYEGEQFDVLLIKLEALNNCMRDAFKDFLNIDEFKLLNKNIGDEKKYSVLYKAFKDSVVMPESYINKMYMSKYVKHFYSEEEIMRFKNRWGAIKESTGNNG